MKYKANANITHQFAQKFEINNHYKEHLN
jgi:hypothetical protein